MLVPLVQTAVGLLLLCLGGESLVRGASALAMRMGMSALAVGLTVVALGTSTPELIVSIDAALSGSSDIAVGNVVGSNIANVALILGLAALLRPIVIQAKVVRIDAPLMLVISLALVAVLADGHASRFEGVLLLLGLAAFVAFTFWEARRETNAVREEFASAIPEATYGIARSLLLVALGLALLVGGGHLLVEAAIVLAKEFGIGEAAIGLTIVAVGTSLPELATSLVAAVRGQGDIAVGNVVGSNIFNILGIFGTTAVVDPLARGAVTWIDIGTMVVLAAVVTIFLATRLLLSRAEGAVLLAAFVAYTGWLLAA